MFHNIASEGEPEQALTWVLNLIFQHENVDCVGEFVKMKLRDLKSLQITQIIACGPSAGKKELMVDSPLAKFGNGIVPLNCSSLFATSLPVLSLHASSHLSHSFIPRVKTYLDKVSDDEPITARGLSKTFP